MKKPLITSGQDWSFDLIEDVYNIIQGIWNEKYAQIPIYHNQIEVITSEQMLDAYTSVGMPLNYPHWSFGESFIKQLESYKRGYTGLAYEIVINSNPCIAYLMEENTMVMQALVIAHACFGHNAFFKNNYLFRQWTHAGAIIDYLVYAKKTIMQYEEQYGVDAVEEVLDAAHALSRHGVDKYKKAPELSPAEEEELQKEREAYNQSLVNEIWNTIPKTKKLHEEEEEDEKFPPEPQENLLYFIEKNAPRLEEWKREIIRIVRMMSQYFYPQMQTKIMNEGTATYFHYSLMHDLYDEKVIDESGMMEFLQSHTNVVFQPDVDDPRYSGINPYALGFAMMQDIERISNNPTEEDKDWLRGQKWVGAKDHIKAIHFAMINFKDESFIKQYLTPKIMRDFRMFSVMDDESESELEVTGIHNSSGYRRVREALSKENNIGYFIPDIQVTNVDRWGDRTMTMQHYMVNDIPLNTEETIETLGYLTDLWGYNVKLESVNNDGEIKEIYDLKDKNNLLDIFLTDS